MSRQQEVGQSVGASQDLINWVGEWHGSSISCGGFKHASVLRFSPLVGDGFYLFSNGLKPPDRAVLYKTERFLYIINREVVAMT